MLAEFHFLRPWWLLALLPLVVLLWQARQRLAGSAWQGLVDRPLLEWLSGQQQAPSGSGRGLSLWLGMAGILAVLALAGPVWERQPQPLLRAVQARVMVLDLSRSMLATDQKPSRLEQALFKLEDILNRSREGQVGLVAFAGEAFVISPLTNDSRTIQALLPALAPDIMPVQGARVDLALQQAADLLTQAGSTTGEILLIADAVNSEQAGPVAEALRRQGMRVSVLAVGTEQGAPIPLPEGGFVQDSDGDIVVPRLQPAELQALARLGGGRFSQLTVDTRDLDYLLPEQSPEQVDRSAADNSRSDAMSSELWREQGPWLILLLLPLAAMLFRRGWLLCWWLLPALLWQPMPAQAAWRDWWRTPAQQTRQALTQGDHQQAAELAEQLAKQPLLAGEAYYRSGDYAAAAQAFSQALEANGNADSAYNLGNALAQQGQYDEAMQAYQEALRQAPGMQDAQANLELLKSLQQEQEQQSQDGEQQQDQQQSSDQQQDQDQSQDQDQTEPQDQQQNQSDQAAQPAQPEEQQQPGAQDEQQPEQQQSDEPSDAARQQPAEQQADPPQQEAQLQPGELSEAEAEQQRAVEQWLRRIPDDPGALLRNKFRYQYQQRQRPDVAGQGDSDEDDW